MIATANQPAGDPSARELVIVRSFDAPRELVWEAWTQQRHVEQWWGPRGFTNTFAQFELRAGGVWRFVMHGPDGRDYPNTIVFREVIPPERLVYTHGGAEGEPAEFQTTVTFAAEGGKTRVTLRAVFPTAEARDLVVREHNAIEGGQETLARCAEYIAEHLTAKR